MPIAAAIAGAAIVGGGASIIAANKGAKAQTNAANQQAQLERENLAQQREIFDTQRADQAPYREAGYGALGQLTAGTVPGGDFNRDFTLADYQADPGLAFRIKQGQRAIDASKSAIGARGSGATLKRLMEYGQEVGSGEFGAAYDRFNNNRTTRFNRLGSLAGIGQTANSANASAGQNFGAQSAAGTGRLGEAIAQRANATASSYAGAAQGINNIASGVGNYFTLRQFMPQQAAFAPQAVNWGAVGAQTGAGGF